MALGLDSGSIIAIIAYLSPYMKLVYYVWVPDVVNLVRPANARQIYGATTIKSVRVIARKTIIIGVGTEGGGTGGMCPPKFRKLLYKLLTTLCGVADCAAPPNQKVFSTPLIMTVEAAGLSGSGR